MEHSGFQRRELLHSKSSEDILPTVKKYVLLCVGVGGILFIGWLFFLWMTLPNIDDSRSLIAAQSTVITDRNGIELYRLFEEQDRTYLENPEIPQSIKNAMVAIEDERFFERGCIDIRAILRAFLANIFKGYKSQGASTITQQLARTALLTRQKRLARKVRELMLACALERKFSKEELLELYLNWIPFGRNAYGIEQASKTYFGKSARDLTLAESTILAALPQRPTYFNPFGSHVHTRTRDGADTFNLTSDDIIIGLIGNTVGTGGTSVYVGGRTDQVLQNMKYLGFIEEKERLSALEELEFVRFQSSRENIRAPHFVLWIRSLVNDMFGNSAEEGLLEQGGLVIETTLDFTLQQLAEESVRSHSGDILRVYGAHNMALVALDAQSKEILAYVGNTNFDNEHNGKIDMVRAPRQPGSSFKPFVYAGAFEKGYSPATVLYDVPTKIGNDEPQNFDGKFVGPVSIRKALGASRNLPAVKGFFLAGREEEILKLTTRMGVTTPQEVRYKKQLDDKNFEFGWPLALGSAEVPLLEMVHGYSTFASYGTFKSLSAIRRITDKYGNILFQKNNDDAGKKVLDPRIAFEITSILSDESARPAEYWRTQLSIPGWQTAAKTGTSNKCLERENNKQREGLDTFRNSAELAEQNKGGCKLIKPNNGWTIGYTPVLTTGVWVGNADGTSMYEKGGGLNTASPIWRNFMIAAHRYIESKTNAEIQKEFDQPDGILQLQVSALSGELPTECTPVNFRKADIFLHDNVPTKQDPACAYLTIDKVTGLLASDDCPLDAQEKRGFLVVRSILPERWPEWEEAVRQWAEEQRMLWSATSDHSGAVLPLPPVPLERCDLALTPGRMEKPTLSIRHPINGGKASFPSFQPKIEFTVGSHRRQIIYFIDQKRAAVVDGTGSTAEPTIHIPRSVQKEGEHVLTVELSDQYFNKASDEVRFRFEEDKNPPHIEFFIPRGDITLQKGAMLQLKAKSSDAEGGIKYIQFFIDDILLTTKPKEPYELTYMLNLPAGFYIIRAVATDLAENEGQATVQLKIE